MTALSTFGQPAADDELLQVRPAVAGDPLPPVGADAFDVQRVFDDYVIVNTDLNLVLAATDVAWAGLNGVVGDAPAALYDKGSLLIVPARPGLRIRTTALPAASVWATISDFD